MLNQLLYNSFCILYRNHEINHSSSSSLFHNDFDLLDIYVELFYNHNDLLESDVDMSNDYVDLSDPYFDMMEKTFSTE